MPSYPNFEHRTVNKLESCRSVLCNCRTLQTIITIVCRPYSCARGSPFISTCLEILQGSRHFDACCLLLVCWGLPGSKGLKQICSYPISSGSTNMHTGDGDTWCNRDSVERIWHDTICLRSTSIAFGGSVHQPSSIKV